MLKVAIVTDGPYGERAYENIKKEFETVFIELEEPASMFMDDIEIPEDKIKEIKRANILITYTLHPDLTLELVERFADDVDWIIVAAWRGEGFKKQLQAYDNIICPYIMCELEKIGDPIYDKFVSHIGRPEVYFSLDGDKMKDVVVLKSSPCGSTEFVAEFIKQKYLGKKLDSKTLPIEAGLKLQHYPCRAAKLRLFSDEECKKLRASGLHKDAFEEAINLAKKFRKRKIKF
jgi:hypothetical protein